MAPLRSIARRALRVRKRELAPMPANGENVAALGRLVKDWFVRSFRARRSNTYTNALAAMPTSMTAIATTHSAVATDA